MSDTINSLDLKSQFEALLSPIFKFAYGVALHLTRKREDAEDLVQEASLQAFRSFHTFEAGTNFKAWFFRILTNRFHRNYRTQKSAPPTAVLEEAPDLYLYEQTKCAGLHGNSADPAALFLSRVDQEQIMAAIAELPEEFRVVIALYFMEEFSYQEIADILECPIGTVRSRLHRGRKALQKTLWMLLDNSNAAQPSQGREKIT